MRRKAKIDSNQNEIVDAFRSLGWSVVSLATIGNGCPDILCGKAGYNILVEIKATTKLRNNLTIDQKKFHNQWLGPLMVITSVEEVIAFTKSRFKSLPELLGAVVN